MQITINSDAQTLADGISLSALLAQFDLAPERVAVEVNERLVRRPTFAQTTLQDGDRVEIVTLIGGG